MIIYESIVTLILIAFVWKMPKYMHRKDMYIIWITVSYLEIAVDLSLGHLLELYHFAGETKISPEAFALKLIMAPLIGIIIINFMPKSMKRFIPYLILWTALSTFFEWTTVLSGYLTYTGWKLWWSTIFYALIIPILRWHYYYIKH